MFQLPWLDSDVLMTPRWTALGVPLQVVLSLVVCLTPLALVLWLYRYELKLVARGTAFGLLLLRLVVLVLLLGLVLLQPVLAHTTSEKIPGRVLVAVDLSESMDVRDPQRATVEKLRLARALKLAGDLASGDQLDNWIAQYVAQKPIVWVKPDEFANDSGARLKAEEERKKAHDQVCARVDALTRAQTAQQLLSRDGGRLLARIGANHHLELFGFARTLKDGKPEQLESLFDRNSPEKEAKKDKSGDKGDAEPVRVVSPWTATSLALPLTRALERSGGRAPILGVIVLTDGQDNVQHLPGNSPIDKALRLRNQKIPLYPVALGALTPPADVNVLAMEAPPVAFKDVEVAVKVRFKVVGMKAQDLTVKIHRPGEEDKPLDQRTIKHDGKDQEYVESLQVTLDKEGQQAIVATVRPVDKEAREARTDNNQQTTVLNVADDQSKVLLIDGEARWEFHYIWNALLRDRSMKVKSVVFTQPRLGKVPEDELRKMNNPWLTLPPPKAGKPEEDPLFAYDCIILGDVTPEQLSLPERLRLEKYVAERGGTLVVLAGKQAMPLAYLALPPAKPGKGPGGDKNEGTDPLIKMLPIESAEEVAPETGFPVTLTEEGKQAEFLRLETEGGVKETLERWAAMPRHYWGVVGKAKKGATTLAYVAGDEKNLTAEEKRQREQEQALFVRHNYGFGRVFFIGLDSTWRYRYRIGDTYHHRFWSQTIRWAASDKPLATGNKFVRFGTPQAVFAGSEPVKVIARLSEAVTADLSKMKVQARILRKAGDKKEVAIAVVTLKRRTMQPRVFEGQVRDLPGGQYLIELDSPDLKDKLEGKPGADGKAAPLRAAFGVTQPESEEMLHLGTNWTLLKELADKNGSGKVYTPENAGELVELLSQKVETHTDQVENPLWQSWKVFLVILVLLTIEWVTRKWIGLP